jgi:glycine betaine/choline ABC-type transport system substrate-binding protein
MTWNQKALLALIGTVFMLSVFIFGKFFIPSTKGIRIGTKNFTEQIILGEILAQYIETRLQLPVELKKNLGGTFVCFRALQAGSLDLYVEYTGTGLTAILKEPTGGNPDEVYQKVFDRFKINWQILWQAPLGFNNTYAITMRREQASLLGISTISDLEAFKGELLPGFNHEFLERPDGYPGLVKHYGFEFNITPKEMDSGLMYRAVSEKQVDVICGFATDGRIPAFDLVILDDDKKFFPPYYAAPLVRAATLDAYPQLKDLFSSLSNKIDDAQMAKMNYLVDVMGELPASVAHRFLQENILDI